ncbi:very-long-chain aldehyde decarbonylase CER1-like [Ziziphus jujuba]|uniref:Very-long-chain aldehyde decarbonylase CER1-like n=1 Tax=Ziziphus jujuba TaxID=326968 RepID=A0ABM4A9E8_ZIZJJ|nr:very-long-chain aldehyde decarbonylase CER1-like [Ziziphus jujuba]
MDIAVSIIDIAVDIVLLPMTTSGSSISKPCQLTLSAVRVRRLLPKSPHDSKDQHAHKGHSKEVWQKFVKRPEEALLQCFPSQNQALRVMIFTSQNQAVLDILSNHSQDEEYLGDQTEATWDEDPVIKAAFECFNGRFHSLHHTQFRTNYSLFMPFYDYMYRTMDKSSDTLYETSLEKGEDSPDVVHLTHLTKPDSIYQLRLGLASVASHPYVSKWYLRMLWPITWWSAVITSISGQTFVLESNKFKNLNLQTWLLPRYIVQYFLPWQREAISRLIEECILDADRNGVKVVSLGLLNQGKKLNKNGEIYVQRHPELKTKVVDGSSLVVAVVLNSIPKGTTQVLLRGNLTKVSYAIAKALCQKGIQISLRL